MGAERRQGASSETAEAALARYRDSGDRRIRNRVVEDHRWLAVVIAREYCTGSEPLDDLIQVAWLAFVKAAERFDPQFGVEFKTFAAVTARGELRRYYRDATWSVRVPRRLQELRYEIRAATDVLSERLGRSPDTSELAAYLHVEPDEIIDCLCADSNFKSLGIEALERGDQHRGGDTAHRRRVRGGRVGGCVRLARHGCSRRGWRRSSRCATCTR